MSRPWLDLLTETAYSPTWRRNVRISRRQWRLLARSFSGRRTRQRRLAADLGYSLSGLHAALESLVTLGLLVKRTRLGRKGWTWVEGRAGALNGNVLQQGRTSSKNVFPLQNISAIVPRLALPEPGGGAFRELMAAAGYRP